MNTKIVKKIPIFDEGEGNICDITPTIINWLIKKGVKIPSHIEGKSHGREIINILHYQKISPESVGWSLENIIENRFGVDISYFDRIIVFVIDGLGYRSFKGIKTKFIDELKPEVLLGSTVFPSMTTTAFTSLFTGAFPNVHRLTADRFYDTISNEQIYIKPGTDVRGYKFPLAFTLMEFVIMGDSDLDIKTSVITAGVTHSDKEDQSFLKRYICDIYELRGVDIGGFFQCHTNYDAFESIIQILKEYNNKNINNFILIIRFSIDWIVHRYGVSNAKTAEELRKILGYIIIISNKIKNIWKDSRTLLFLLSDHGHKDVDYGLVSYKDEIEPILSNVLKEYQFVATNQTALSFYISSFRGAVSKYESTWATILHKKEGDYYAYDPESKKLCRVKILDPSEVPTIRLRHSRYKINDYIGDYLILADNFYFGYYPKKYYNPNYLKLKAAHGGLSYSEIMIPFLFWVA